MLREVFLQLNTLLVWSAIPLRLIMRSKDLVVIQAQDCACDRKAAPAMLGRFLESHNAPFAYHAWVGSAVGSRQTNF